MMINKISFESGASKRIYSDYMTRVEKSLKSLSAADKNEMLMEINSHIYEGTVNCSEANEVNVLLDVLEKLGSPEEFLTPLVARKKLDQAVRTFNPVDMVKAIVLNLKNGVRYTMFGLLYLFLSVFIFLSVSKILYPGNTGLFYDESGFAGFGFILNTSGFSEVLGYWIIPLSILTAAFLYLCITLMIKISRK